MADQVDKIAENINAPNSDKTVMSHRLNRLCLRSRALDAAVILGAIGGSATCATVLTMFYGALRNSVAASALYGLFALAIVCTIAALCAFTVEMLLASRLLRLRITHGERDAKWKGASNRER